MDHSMKSPDDSGKDAREPLAGGRVSEVAAAGKGDLSDWVELMAAVEALCGVWPAAPAEMRGEYRL